MEIQFITDAKGKKTAAIVPFAELIPEALDDFNSLDGSVRKRVLKQLVKLGKNPK